MSKFLPQSTQLTSTNNNTTPDHSFIHRVICIDTLSPEQSVYVNALGYVQIVNMPAYTSNALAIAGGLALGFLYRNGDVVQIVH